MERDCDICKQGGITTPATVDAKMIQGPWAYMCDHHNSIYGTGIKGLTNVLADIGKSDKVEV